MQRYRLCHIDDLKEGSCREFEIPGPPEMQALQGFLIKRHSHIYAYRNQCPHTGVTLNWLPNQFMDMDNEFIQCATHGALFRVEDGYCVRGPCAGASLVSLQVVTIDQDLYWQENKSQEDKP